MSESIRQTRLMHEALIAIAESGKEHVHPGDLVAYMRDQNTPMDNWSVTGQLNLLVELGLATLNRETATWSLVPGKDFAELLDQLKSRPSEI